MSVGAIGGGSVALDMVRSATEASSTQDEVQISIAKKSLDEMKVEGQAAVQLIQSSDLGRYINVRA